MSRVRLLLPVIVASLALAGCVRLPDDGPVVEAGQGEGSPDAPAGAFDPVPPVSGASRQAVVEGFLDAMTGWPNQTNVAQQYLSSAAAEEWNPELGTIVYDGTVQPQEVDGQVVVELPAAERLDASRAWRGSLSEGELTLAFQLTVEDGEFRIVDPPDALVVPASWFQQRFRQVSLYYFDRTAQILVPEPVFVPEGEQLATSLVSALLTGPSPRLDDVVTSFVPPGLDEGLSVPVSEDGVAALDLVGDAPRPSAEEAELMLAQLAWTLRQDPEVSAIRVSIGGEPVPLSGGALEYDLDDASAFDPAGASATTELYGLRRGRVVAGTAGAMAPVTGPLGRSSYGLTQLAAAPRNDRVAGVTAGGTTLLVAPLHTEVPDERVRTVVDDATDLARPSWDYLGRLWVLDRTREGAAIQVLEPGRQLREVVVPGVTGADARRLMVSRDGTRLVAVVRGAGVDRLVVARVLFAPTGRVQQVVWSTVTEALGGVPRIIDIAWVTPSTIAVLTPARPGSLFEVDTVVADGGSVGDDAGSTIVSGRVLGIAGASDEDVDPYAVLRSAVLDLATRETTPLGGPTEAVDYAG